MKKNIAIVSIIVLFMLVLCSSFVFAAATVSFNQCDENRLDRYSYKEEPVGYYSGDGKGCLKEWQGTTEACLKGDCGTSPCQPVFQLFDVSDETEITNFIILSGVRCGTSKARIMGHCYNDERDDSRWDRCTDYQTVEECAMEGDDGGTDDWSDDNDDDWGDDMPRFFTTCADVSTQVCFNGACRTLGELNNPAGLGDDRAGFYEPRPYLPASSGWTNYGLTPSFRVGSVYAPNVKSPTAYASDYTVYEVYLTNRNDAGFSDFFFSREMELSQRYIIDTKIISGLYYFNTSFTPNFNGPMSFEVSATGGSAEYFMIITDSDGNLVTATTDTSESFEVEGAGFNPETYNIALYMQYKSTQDEQWDATSGRGDMYNGKWGTLKLSILGVSRLSDKLHSFGVDLGKESEAQPQSGYTDPCNDEFDNDNDGFVDKFDPDCGIVGCLQLTNGEEVCCGVKRAGEENANYGEYVRDGEIGYVCHYENGQGVWSAASPGRTGRIITIANDTSEGGVYQVASSGLEWWACDRDTNLGNFGGPLISRTTNYKDYYVCYEKEGEELIEECKTSPWSRILKLEGRWTVDPADGLLLPDIQTSYDYAALDPESMGDYDYLEFDVFFENDENINLRVGTRDFLIKDHLTSSLEFNEWKHVMLPVKNIGTADKISIRATSPTPGDASTLKIDKTFYLTKTGDNQYCALASAALPRWISDLDLDNAIEGPGQACEDNSKAFTWTGTKCCGEDMNEYYADNQSGCYNSQSAEEGELVDQKAIYSQGKFHECGGTTTRQYFPNPANLAEAGECMNIGDYYCGLDGLWQNATETYDTPISAASTLPDGTDKHCCPEFSCWDGSTCVDSQKFDPGATPHGFAGEEYLCIDGKWAVAVLKHTWDFTQKGFCREEPDCLVELDGNPDNDYDVSVYDETYPVDNPTCIAEGQYIKDHYCDKGNWTTRTKFLALTMLNMTEGDYTLHCDTAENALNYYLEAAIPMATKEQAIFQNLVDNNFYNNWCILQTGNQIIVGTTINDIYPIQIDDLPTVAVKNTLNITGFESLCSEAIQGTGFKKCQTDNLWFENKTRTIIYSNKPITSMPKSYFEGLADNLFETITNPVLSLLDFILGPYGFPLPDFQFINKTRDFDRLYIKKYQGKTIRGVVETKQSSPEATTVQSFLTIQYEGFTPQICESTKSFDIYREDSRVDIACKTTPEGTTVLTTEGWQDDGLKTYEFENFWKEAVTATRIS